MSKKSFHFNFEVDKNIKIKYFHIGTAEQNILIWEVRLGQGVGH